MKVILLVQGPVNRLIRTVYLPRLTRVIRIYLIILNKNSVPGKTLSRAVPKGIIGIDA